MNLSFLQMKFATSFSNMKRKKYIMSLISAVYLLLNFFFITLAGTDQFGFASSKFLYTVFIFESLFYI